MNCIKMSAFQDVPKYFFLKELKLRKHLVFVRNRVERNIWFLYPHLNKYASTNDKAPGCIINLWQNLLAQGYHEAYVVLLF